MISTLHRHQVSPSSLRNLLSVLATVAVGTIHHTITESFATNSYKSSVILGGQGRGGGRGGGPGGLSHYDETPPCFRELRSCHGHRLPISGVGD